MSFLTFYCAVLLTLCGVLFTVKSGFYVFKRPGDIVKCTVGKLVKERNPDGFKAMSIALGSTIGIGNIVGVASAICVGGPGAVFWMLLFAFIGMMTKYAEIYISVKDANDNNRQCGGPMYVMESMFRGSFKRLGALFAAACCVGSFFSGNILQSKSVYEFARLGFGLGFLPVTLITVPLLGIIIFGKDKLYQNFSAVFVPLMSVFYIIATIGIIIANINNVPSALLSVITSAFGFKGIAGGFCGSVLAVALRTGVMRGLFTNEAGLGSAPIAHCSAKVTDPHSQGCWGIVEVFVDTVVVCMLTALAVLSSDIYRLGLSTEPFTLVCRIFEDTFGSAGLKVLCISAYCFAFASIVGWSFYGIKSLQYLSDSAAARKVYIIVFLAFVPLSNILSGDIIWLLTDLFNSTMLIPNASMLLYAGSRALPKNIGRIKTKKAAA